MTFLEIFRLVVLTGILFWVSYTDFRTGKIPNAAVLTGIAVGLLAALVNGLTTHRGLGEFLASLGGMVVGAGPLLLVYLLGLAIRKPLMGAGDVKLMAAIGALIGPLSAMGVYFTWWCLFFGLTLAGIYGILAIVYALARRRPFPKTIALGACLSLGTLMAILTFAPSLGVYSWRPTPGSPPGISSQ